MPMHNRLRLPLALFAALCCFTLSALPSIAQSPAGQPRIAIWNPVFGTREPRIKLDLAALDQMANWIKDSGGYVGRLTADQIADPATFSAKQFDAVLFLGNAFPRADIPALKQFADEGGVLIDLAADVPFLITIAPGNIPAHGNNFAWVLSPSEPKFAWQTNDLLKHLGLAYLYKPALHDQGVIHTATPLFKRYLPQAPDLRGQLSSRWVVPLPGAQAGQIYPLLRSQRRDGADVPPQIYIVRHHRATAIVTTSPAYTSNASPALWSLGRETLLALTRLAHDLHHGTVQLKPDMAVTIPAEMTPLPPAPLDRFASGSINPDHATPVARWGRFDGSSAEFGPALAAGQSRDLPAHAPSADFPAALSPGATVHLALPDLGQGPLFLRIRGAYLATGAGLKATLGKETVFDETFVYIDSSAPGNFNRNLVGVPAEFTRIVYLPPPPPPELTPAGGPAPVTLTLTNPGTAPLYFDAVQIERRTQPTPRFWIGLGAGPGSNRIAPQITHQWSAVRTSLRTNFIGPPDDPKRFDKVDALFHQAASLNDHVQPILEGTPPWAAISAERLEEARKAKRPTTVPPDPAQYAQIVQDVVARYGAHVNTWEVWNEADITQFYRGTPGEYITLFKTVAPIIRHLAPQARLMTTGMSGYHEAFLRALRDAGVLNQVDLIAFHPYAGKSPAWDMTYGRIQGTLMSWGVNKQIYCNESGFPCRNVEWFQPPPDFTPQEQARMLNVAMARLLACGLSKLNIFNAGGDGNPYGLFDNKGQPRPAYDVFADYVPLGLPEARRLDVCLTRLDGHPMSGIYTAAAAYPDDRATLIINPAECQTLLPVENPTPQLSGSAHWTTFFGHAAFQGDQVTVTPAANRKYAGFYKAVAFDPRHFPTLQVSAAGPGCDWDLLLKHPDKTITTLATHHGPGTLQVDLNQLLPQGGRQSLEISFRVYRPTTFSGLHLLAAAHQPPPQPIPLRLRVPLPDVQSATATLSVDRHPHPVDVKLRHGAGQTWAELILPLRTRCVIQIQGSQ